MVIPCVLASSLVGAAVIVEDDFERGAWKDFWDSRTKNVTISREMSKDGNYSSKWVYPGGSVSDDGWAEARFDLGAEYREVTISFDIFIPENYWHRNGDSADNNKLFRLWQSDYKDREKVGASLNRQGDSGDSLVGGDYRQKSSWGMSTAVNSSQDFITSNDRGKWMAISIYVRAASDTESAIIRIHKNGKQHFEDVFDNNHIPGAQGFRYGYLLGWSNSGYSEETTFYIDNVRFLSHEVLAGSPPLDPGGVGVSVKKG